ncbi:MAG: lysylphosphatidylglycerol synthase domain-containing protein, partial [Steroidobacteraceae bacterium]
MASTATDEEARADRSGFRWIGPLMALLVFAGVAFVLRRELAHLQIRSVFTHLHGIPRSHIIAALGFTALSYWLLSTYEVLALRYLGRKIAYGRIVFTSFIAYSFGHTLGFAAFTGAAIRFRLYATAGVTAIEVATVSAFCSLSVGIGLVAISGLSLLVSPEQAELVLHLDRDVSMLIGIVLLGAIVAYGSWASLAKSTLEIRGWALRAPGPSIGLPQIALAMMDLSLAGAVVWWLLPADANVDFITFLGAYAAAVIAGIVSHVPGGIGVFETVMLLALPNVPPEVLLGSLLAYRAVYYLVPILFGAILFGAKELSAASTRIARAHQLASAYVAPVVPQVSMSLLFMSGSV